MLRLKTLKPAQKRNLTEGLQVSYEVSQRGACSVLRVARSTVRHQSVVDDKAALQIRLWDLVASRVR